ncbi:hypothetical protein DERF_013343 [Dermatophagoides farinae]|uniref:Uncharacterized protein n=1 Tax=Dermatophagoides farinae TaxID=6954 RepID=A0A922HM56_DERFA|nr:hypothetical protein DERF_013343 [Dermatophagoides farinae]
MIRIENSIVHHLIATLSTFVYIQIFVFILNDKHVNNRNSRFKSLSVSSFNRYFVYQTDG